MKPISLILGNTAARGPSPSYEAVIRVWKDVESTLDNYPLDVFKIDGSPLENKWHVSLDTSDVVEFFRLCKSCDTGQSDDPFFERMKRQHDEGLGLLSSIVRIQVNKVVGPDAEDVIALNLGRLIQRLFLAMNLAVPGCFHLSISQFTFKSHYVAPSLHAELLENASRLSTDRGWPTIDHLDFADVWRWLDVVLPTEIDVAEKPIHRALFNLLRLCSIDWPEPDGLLIVAQTLESLFAPGKEQIGGLLKRRIYSVLGEPEAHKSWFSRFYDLRSRVAHGDIPLVRPNNLALNESVQFQNYYANYFTPLEEAASVMLAVLQDLVKSRAVEYDFTESLERKSLAH